MHFKHCVSCDDLPYISSLGAFIHAMLSRADSSADMGTGHFFGHASNPTHLRLTRDPTRPGFIKMQCVMLLCACKNNMKPLKHFIIALPMFNTRRNRRIHISYKSWTQYTRYVVKDQSHESSRQRDTCHYPFTQLSTNKSVRSCCLDDVD